MQNQQKFFLSSSSLSSIRFCSGLPGGLGGAGGAVGLGGKHGNSKIITLGESTYIIHSYNREKLTKSDMVGRGGRGGLRGVNGDILSLKYLRSTNEY